VSDFIKNSISRDSFEIHSISKEDPAPPKIHSKEIPSKKSYFEQFNNKRSIIPEMDFTNKYVKKNNAVTRNNNKISPDNSKNSAQ